MPNWVKNIINVESPNIEVIRQIKDFFGELCFDNIRPTPETLNISSGSTSDAAFRIYTELLNNNGIVSDAIRNNKIFKDLPIIPNPNNPDDIIGLRSENISYLYKDDPNITDLKQINRYPKNRGDLIILGRIQYINIMMYGFKDWYDYHCNYWGTKWSASYHWDKQEEENWYKEFENNGVYLIKYTFRTAWSCPFGIIDEFLFKFGYRKDVRLNLQWADEDYSSYNQGWLLKDYHNIALNSYQLLPVNIGNDRIKFSEMIWDN